MYSKHAVRSTRLSLPGNSPIDQVKMAVAGMRKKKCKRYDLWQVLCMAAMVTALHDMCRSYLLGGVMAGEVKASDLPEIKWTEGEESALLSEFDVKILNHESKVWFEFRSSDDTMKMEPLLNSLECKRLKPVPLEKLSFKVTVERAPELNDKDGASCLMILVKLCETQKKVQSSETQTKSTDLTSTKPNRLSKFSSGFIRDLAAQVVLRFYCPAPLGEEKFLYIKWVISGVKDVDGGHVVTGKGVLLKET